MRYKVGVNGLVCIMVLLIVQCIDPFSPPEIEQAEAYLVVDGYVDVERGEAVIKLTRTQNLADASSEPLESGAQVTLEINGSTTYPLSEESTGVYSRFGLSIDFDDQCKLLIRTGGKDYESSIVKAIRTPEIDSVTYRADDTGVRIEVTTHDPGNNTWYYQWRYEETAQYRSRFQSLYTYGGFNNFLNRTVDNDIYVCWKTYPSTTILVGTSSGLSDDVIYKFPLTFLPSTSWKLSIKYSIMVRQFAIDKDAYNYWTELKKNTETVGSLFDPQPSQVTGNFRCTSDPSEPILGYFSVRSIKEKRIFLERFTDIPDYTIISGYAHCLPSDTDTVELAEINDFPDRYLLINTVYAEGSPALIGFTSHSPVCIDCRLLRDGTTTKPDFWE